MLIEHPSMSIYEKFPDRFSNQVEKRRIENYCQKSISNDHSSSEDIENDGASPRYKMSQQSNCHKNPRALALSQKIAEKNSSIYTMRNVYNVLL